MIAGGWRAGLAGGARGRGSRAGLAGGSRTGSNQGILLQRQHFVPDSQICHMRTDFA
jgi:hypothetical protein